MRDVYDNPENLFDEQATILPRGPIGLLLPPEIHVDTRIRPEIANLVAEWENGNLTEIEFAMLLSAIKKPAKPSIGI